MEEVGREGVVPWRKARSYIAVIGSHSPCLVVVLPHLPNGKSLFAETLCFLSWLFSFSFFFFLFFELRCFIQAGLAGRGRSWLCGWREGGKKGCSGNRCGAKKLRLRGGSLKNGLTRLGGARRIVTLREKGT